jgi:asparagine synthase (glutamine-hydrolysing)
MCGIAGMVDFTGRPTNPEVLRAMTDTLTHRGPDDEGFYHSDSNGGGVSVGLGHRRLSIIDLSPNGRQPMANETEDVWMVFNGEIYNFRQLRDELVRKGHQFRSQTDCEVVLHAYEEYGAGCVERLNGMFAFALWDERAQRLLLARDRVGKKPLLYAWDGGRLLFASEFQGLLACPEVPRSPEPFALDLFLRYGVIPAPFTAYNSIRKLRPGHLAEVSAGSFDERPYWQISFNQKRRVVESDAVDELRSLIADAVAVRLVSDVPLGAFLSGGVDSSAVVAMMSQAALEEVKTFSIGFPVAAYNELPYARLVAERYQTSHKEFVVEPDAVEVLPLLARHYGEPYADSSALPSYYLARMTRQHVTVALNGDGGDECFGGYERQWANALADRMRWVPPPLLKGLTSVLPDSVDPKNRWRRARRFLAVATQSPLSRYRHWLGIFPSSLLGELYTPAFRDSADANGREDPFEEAFRATEGLDPIDQAIAIDTAFYLPHDLMVKMDIASMANSLEVRSPLLDYRLLEYCASLPGPMKIRRGRLKHLLKEVMRKELPTAVLSRPKQGFGVPLGSWYRGELESFVREMLLSPRALDRGLFRPDAVRALVAHHLKETHDYSFHIWALMMLELWFRTFIDTSTPSSPAQEERGGSQ